MPANSRMRRRSSSVKRSRSTGLSTCSTPTPRPLASSGTARMARVLNPPCGSPCQRGSAATSLTTSGSADCATLPTMPWPSGTRRPRISPAASPRTTRKNSSPRSSSSSQIELVSAWQTRSAVDRATSSTVARSRDEASWAPISSSVSYSARRPTPAGASGGGSPRGVSGAFSAVLASAKESLLRAQRLELPVQPFDRLEALGRVLAQAAQDRRLEPRRHLRPAAARRRRLFLQVLDQHLHRGAGPEGHVAGEDLVQHHPRRINDRAPTGLAALHLVRRQVKR